jgi:hypothetical protein
VNEVTWLGRILRSGSQNRGTSLIGYHMRYSKPPIAYELCVIVKDITMTVGRFSKSEILIVRKILKCEFRVIRDNY